MRVMALDSTTRDGSIAIVDDDAVLFEERGDPDRPTAERLPGDLVRALDSTGLRFRDIDVFAVVRGPGSFTGVRIGIGTIQGMALVHSRGVVAISTLEVLAEAGGLFVGSGALVGTWMDARRQSVFSGLWRITDLPAFARGRVVIVEPPAVENPEDTIVRWQSGLMPAVIVGDGGERYEDVIGNASRVRAAPPLATVLARMAVARARAGDMCSPASVHPEYVRRPDVELLRDARS